jgi:HAD superfamily hydrolase (TIGR01484 family)
MIKLIASDLDGTLLQNGAQQLTNEVIPYIKKLQDMGIIFVAASGRQYANMQRLFEPIKEEIAFICENGALVIYKGKILHKTIINKEIGEEILVDIRNREGCEILLSGLNTSYLEPKTNEYAHRMQYIVKNNVTIVKDILNVSEDYQQFRRIF